MGDTIDNGPARRAPLTIGAFSAATRISVRMLRHYDEHGVLVPAEIDPVTGYRRFESAQIADGHDLRRLRDVGFGVSALGTMLAARGTPAYADALRLQRETLTTDLHAASQRLALLTHLLAALETGPRPPQRGTPMSITVSRVSVPARTVVALRGTIPSYADEGQLWAQFMPELAAQGIAPIGPCGTIEHDDEFRESDVDESVFLPVAPGTTARSPLEVIDLPAIDAIKATVVGPYTLIAEAHSQIGEYAAAQDLRSTAGEAERPIGAKVFNVYLADPSNTPEDRLVTEVYCPLV